MIVKALGWLGGVALALALVLLYGNARHDTGAATERAAWLEKSRAQDKVIAELRAGFLRASADSASRYAEKLESLEPIIVRSTDTVTRYAQTPEGSARCLSGERVLGIDANAAALGLAGARAAEGGDAGLPPDADRP